VGTRLLIAVSPRVDFRATVVATFAAEPGIRLRDVFNTPLQRLAVVALAACAAAYTIFVFYERASAAEVPPTEYALEFLPFLGLEPEPTFASSLKDDPLDSLAAMIVLSVSYVTHSFATVAAIVDAPAEDKSILFIHVISILNKLGLAHPPDADWFLSGRFPSLPGALLHEFGVAGLFIGSITLGVVSALAAIWSARNPGALLPLGCSVLAGAVLLLSPALLAFDFLSFPFVIAAFAILAGASRVWTRRKGLTHSRSAALQAHPRR
jgi:hypothetical protein